MKTIIVCGGDLRNYYLCLSLIEKGYSVKWIYAENFDKDDAFIEKNYLFESADALILPLPLSRDGKHINAPYSNRQISVDEIKNENGYGCVFTSDPKISGINYFADEAVTVDNARLTAIGFLKELLIYETEDIKGKNALVTGYGRVSSAVCDVLSRNMVNVTVAARNKNQRHIAASRGLNALDLCQAQKNFGAYDYVINTVPHRLFSDEYFEKSNKKTAFFELASSMCDGAKKKPKAYIECKGMPGKHTPESAGKVIADFVCQKLEE